MAQIIEQIVELRTPMRLNGFINGKTVTITRDNEADRLHFGKEVSLHIYDRTEIAGGRSRYQIARQPHFSTKSKLLPARRGDMMQTIRHTFPTAMFFGFTGTPIHDENQKKQNTMVDVFGDELHCYSIADGIRDRNVLGFDPYKVLTYRDKDLREAVALDQAKAGSVSEALSDPTKKSIYLRFMGLPMPADALDVDGNPVHGIEYYIPKSQYRGTDGCGNREHMAKVASGDAGFTELEAILDELHGSFASLDQEQQRYADLVIQAAQGFDLELKPGMTFMDYINQFQARGKTGQVKALVGALGIDENQLRALMAQHVTEANINEFGRLDSLKKTANAELAK